jgi:poly(3-hydroxyalkanoate) depolymerase
VDDDVRRVSVLGQTVRVSVRAGTEPGRPPLVLCNGIGARLELLQPFVDRVDPSIEVIRFDVPGVGESRPSPFPYTFPGLALLLGRVLSQMGYDTFDVLGISWGGGLAQQVAFQYPRRCRRAVLASTATGSLMVPANPRVLGKMITPRRYRDPDYAKSVAAELYGGRLRDEPGLAPQLLHNQSHVSRRGYLMQLLAGAGWTSLPALPFIRQPVLILAGRDDPIIPVVNARIMHRLLPHSQLHVYDDGHLGLVTKADELAPLVSEFVLRSAARATGSLRSW